MGDANLLRLALYNLLDNAWKFTRQVEHPLIEFGQTDYGGERAFFVRDNGAGFDMRYVAKLFEPFSRLHSAEEYEGAGVGLANVKRIIERHGGRIWAQGVQGYGAVFYFTLPALQVAHQMTQA
jgi:signal transduction histidine kinase